MNKEIYRHYRKNREKAGLLYQDFIVDLAWKEGLVIAQYSSQEYQIGIGESRTGAEIKFDEQSITKPNLYIEVSEKARPRKGDYAPSGIYANEKTWLYIIGNYDEVYVFHKNILQLLHKSRRYREIEINMKTSCGFLIPKTDASLYAKVWMPNGSQKISNLILQTKDIGMRGKMLHDLVMQKKNENQLALF